MNKLLRKFLVIAMLGLVPAGAFAQKSNQDKRPPKEPVKIKTNDKDQRPPRNSNQQQPKPNKPGRP